MLDGQEVVLQTDHRNLTYLMNLTDPSGRMGRWVLRLSEHKFLIEYRKGQYMEIADCMSRNPKPTEPRTAESAPETINKEYEMLMVQLNLKEEEDFSTGTHDLPRASSR